MRIYVLGHSGSGKTYFSTQLSKKLSIQHIELDKIWFANNKNRNSFKEDVLKRAQAKDWIIEGKHKTVRNSLISLADQVIYLDLGLYNTIMTNIKRELESGSISLGFVRHLIKVVRQYFTVQQQISNELNLSKVPTVVLKSRTAVNHYLEGC